MKILARHGRGGPVGDKPQMTKDAWVSGTNRLAGSGISPPVSPWSRAYLRNVRRTAAFGSTP